MDHQKIVSNINRIIEKAGAICIVISKPVDPDCVGTALALQWFLLKKGKEADIISFSKIPATMETFPSIEKITVKAADTFEFKKSSTFMLVDGSSWNQFFGDNSGAALNQLNLLNIIHIDHHHPDQINSTVRDTSLNIITSSTAQVLYDFFISPSGIKLEPFVADYLYLALIADSRNFKNEIHRGEYMFAEKLIEAGADHLKAVDVNYDMRDVIYLEWALRHTEYFPEYRLTLLCIDNMRCLELEKLIGKNWKDFSKIYKEVIKRQISGYDYGITLIQQSNDMIDLGWRTRNAGNTLCIAEIASRAGFDAGGHRNAGGGKFKGAMSEAKEKILQELKHKSSAAIGKASEQQTG